MSIPRSVLRGYPLLPMCRLAKISKHEYGPDDDRCFCYGLVDGKTDAPLYECVNCGAYVIIIRCRNRGRTVIPLWGLAERCRPKHTGR